MLAAGTNLVPVSIVDLGYIICTVHLSVVQPPTGLRGRSGPCPAGAAGLRGSRNQQRERRLLRNHGGRNVRKFPTVLARRANCFHAVFDRDLCRRRLSRTITGPAAATRWERGAVRGVVRRGAGAPRTITRLTAATRRGRGAVRGADRGAGATRTITRLTAATRGGQRRCLRGASRSVVGAAGLRGSRNQQRERRLPGNHGGRNVPKFLSTVLARRANCFHAVFDRDLCRRRLSRAALAAATERVDW